MNTPLNCKIGALMAQLIEGDGRGLHRGLMGNTPGLPPRFPTLPNRGIPFSDLNTVFQGIYGNSAILGRNHWQHKGTPSYSVVVRDRPLSYADLEEESELSIKKALHWRSASDSFTYAADDGNVRVFNCILEEGESKCETSQTLEKLPNDGKEDGDQLTDLLDEIQQLQDQQNLPISTRSQAVHLNLESSIVSKAASTRATLESEAGHLALEPKGMMLEDTEYHIQDCANGDTTSLAEQPEIDLDPKKAKRVLANRQSAQRSRVRKLQYIAELEGIVSTLQMEVSTLSLQMIYLKHQRALLNMDNNALKKQVVFFVQEKRNKDSQNEMLKRDIRRLKKLSEFQSLHKSSEMQKQQQPQHRHIQRHSSLPTDFIARANEPGELNVKSEFSSADGLTGLMIDFVGMSLDGALRREKVCRDMDCVGAGAASTMELNRVVAKETVDGEVSRS